MYYSASLPGMVVTRVKAKADPSMLPCHGEQNRVAERHTVDLKAVAATFRHEEVNDRYPRAGQGIHRSSPGGEARLPFVPRPTRQAV
jgi:hypothetical protein